MKKGAIENRARRKSGEGGIANLGENHLLVWKFIDMSQHRAISVALFIFSW